MSRVGSREVCEGVMAASKCGEERDIIVTGNNKLSTDSLCAHSLLYTFCSALSSSRFPVISVAHRACIVVIIATSPLNPSAIYRGPPHIAR